MNRGVIRARKQSAHFLPAGVLIAIANERELIGHIRLVWVA